MMKDLLLEERFAFISPPDRAFIQSFDDAIEKLGYDCGGVIGSGYCWGRYMIIYAKTNVKSRPVPARIYIRDDSIVLRLYLNQIDDHRHFIEHAPDYIKEVFTGSHGQCKHCANDHGGSCKFRKSYTIDQRLFEKCNGITFEFWQPSLAKLPDYMNLLKEFTGRKNRSV